VTARPRPRTETSRGGRHRTPAAEPPGGTETEAQTADRRRGLIYAIAANLLWGVFPLYWPLLKPATAMEILAHRIVWSLLFVVVLILATRRIQAMRELVRRRRAMAALAGAALFQGVNWWTYIYAVNSGHVLQASLGYFITPLLVVLLAVVVLRESLRPFQWFAVGLGLAAVVVLTVDYGEPPWLALTLGACFAVYGFLKRAAGSGALEGVAVETGLLAGPALVWITWLGFQGEGSFSVDEPAHALLLVSSGLLTMLPLLFFGASATRLSLTTLGLLQYLAPVLQWVIGVAVLHEPMPLSRLIGFALVWCALVVLALDGWRGARRVVAAAESR
jgi:chloramphenicol-sensitive protein RarD